MKPEDIPLGWYTHINFAFALVNPTTFRIDAMDSNMASLYQRVTAMKQRQEPGSHSDFSSHDEMQLLPQNSGPMPQMPFPVVGFLEFW